VRETFPQLLNTYVHNGQARYVVKNFLMLSIFPESQKAAEAAECAGAQGLYWEMRDALFLSQEEWSLAQNAEEIFKSLAGDLGLDQARFDECLDQGKYADVVAADYQGGLEAEVSGTPTFWINGTKLDGAVPLTIFQQHIEHALGGG
jgi:protein-disulfide isomerase